MEEKFTTILDRLEELITAKQLSFRAFSNSIGVPPMTLSSMLKRRSDPSSLFIATILSVYSDVSPDWLLLDKGSMLKSEETKPKVSYSSGRPYYNVDFIGGFDLVLNDQTINPEYNIDFSPYNKEGVLWCNITGHSMSPEISSGDMMAIREVLDWDKFLTMNETYAIVTRNDLRTVKKIRKGCDSDHFLLVPVNKEYDEQEIAIGMILKVYSVLGCMKRF